MNSNQSAGVNPNIQGLKKSATLAINEQSRELSRGGKKIFRFGFGQSPFPVPQTVVQSLRENAACKDYLPVEGLGELRAAVAEFHARKHGLHFSKDDVFIGPGSKELMFILQLVYESELLLPAPSWVSYAPQAAMIGRDTKWLNASFSDDWRLTPETLAQHCEKAPSARRLLILNCPGNPTGGTYTADQLAELAEIARKHKVIILSDEIYGELHHRGEHVSIGRFYPEGTIVSSGLSKWCGAGGWRLGTFAVPPQMQWIRKAMGVVGSETFSTASAPVQFAAVTAFANGAEIESYLTNSRRILQALGNRAASLLRDFGVSVVRPDGAFYLFPDFSPLKEKFARRGITNSVEFCQALLEETGVALLPGIDFGRPAEELTTRLAYVNFDGGKALEAAERLASTDQINDQFLEEFCGDTLAGVKKLCDWLS